MGEGPAGPDDGVLVKRDFGGRGRGCRIGRFGYGGRVGGQVPDGFQVDDVRRIEAEERVVRRVGLVAELGV